MRTRSIFALTLPAVFGLGLAGCQYLPTSGAQSTTPASYWPTAQSPVKKDPAMEAEIANLLGQMSLEQKVAQMIQADIGSVSAEEMRRYRIGSVLNGGGQTPNDNTSASASDWATFADKLFSAAMAEEPGKVPIPLFWGIDAVHGHGNVRGATLYPHNIALGASRNGDLVRAINEATAKEIAATGLDWNFAPTVAVAQDDRWGRTYESFSEDPELVARLGAEAVLGLQGEPNSPSFLDQSHVIATAKHFIGDGGTRFGDDQGETVGDEQQLIELHLPGYVSAIEAGVQTVMASYTWWDGIHAHANKRLLTGLLKDHLGFDGLVVSDWQAIAHVPGCTIDSCAEAINAGVDLFMIPNAPEWQQFLANTVKQVKDGEITMARIDDAVSRILRVKMRAGLWDKPSPAKRELASRQNLLGHQAHRNLARKAVRQSMVLLKNTGVLPLAPDQTILVAGAGANSLSMQAGGWSVTWQGNNNPNSAYPGATTIYQGIKKAVAAQGGRAILSEKGEVDAKVDAAIVIFGEQPYAEMHGDLQNLSTLEFQQHDKQALKLLQKLKTRGIPVVAVFLSGRPMWVNKELNAADAFVAAWQPGTEGAGVADVLIAKADGSANHDFAGKLSFSWPKEPCQTDLNRHQENYDPLFPFGFGLTYEDTTGTWQPLPEDTSRWTYGCQLGADLPEASTVNFTPDNGWRFFAERKSLEREPFVEGEAAVGAVTLTPALQDHGVQAKWDGSELGRVSLRNDKRKNNFLPAYANSAAVALDVELLEQPSAQVQVGIFSGPLTHSYIDITEQLKDLPIGVRQSISIDLRCFTRDRIDMMKVDVPFALQTTGTMLLGISNVRYEPSLADKATITCP